MTTACGLRPNLWGTCWLGLPSLVVAVGLAVSGGLLAQEPLPSPPSAAERPTVPLLEPRPAEGQAAEQRWQTQREPADREPVAAFLKSIQGSDVAIEVTLGQGRLLTTKRPIADERGQAVIAVGDPSILDFEVLPNPRMIRLIGKRPGVTDLSITTADDQTHVFEVHVVYDLPLMTARLRQVFPDAEIRITQLRSHIVLEGQARSIAQVAAIEKSVQAYVDSLTSRSSGAVGAPAAAAGPSRGTSSRRNAGEEAAGTDAPQEPESSPRYTDPRAEVEPGQRGGPQSAAAPPAEIINLMRVPGLHQVMLQVRIGELNRTGLREIGADWFFEWGKNNKIGTQVAGSSYPTADNPVATLAAITGLNLGTNSTGFGVFPSGNVEIALRALRENSLLNVLAEPNLMAMSGQQASFLAGGQFPVPVPQGGGITNQVTVQYKDFGVQLSFVPTVMDDETIRLKVSPEVSSIDQSLGTTLVTGGDPIPGLNTRRVDTTVELKQGHTLALAGLLQVELDAKTDRIPGVGDLPYLGPFFSNTSHRRIEKELLVLVTPYLVHAMTPDQVPPLPGSEIQDPNDLEFYFLNRLEGRTGKPFRATMSWDNPLHLVELMKLEQRYICGPVGFSE